MKDEPYSEALLAILTNEPPGRIVVRLGRDGEPAAGTGDEVTILVTPDQWEEVLVENAGDDVHMFLWELFGPPMDDERFVVFYDGDLSRSTREEIPPVRSARAQE